MPAEAGFLFDDGNANRPALLNAVVLAVPQLEFNRAFGENGGKVSLGANPSGIHMGGIVVRYFPATALLNSSDTR